MARYYDNTGIGWKIFSLFLALILVAGVITGVVFWQNGNIEFHPIGQEQTDEPSDEPTDNGGAVIGEGEENGIKIASVKIPIEDYAANGISPTAETAYKITATIEPASALQRAVWSLAWKNDSSEWATGKTVTDYVTVTPTEDGALTATLSCVKAFSEQVILTVSAAGNTAKTATCVVDYQQRLVVNSLKFGDVELSTETCNFNVDLFETYIADLDFSYSEGSLAYLGEGDNGYDEFICGGIAFTDEFIEAYNSLNGSDADDLSLKMNRGNLSVDVESAREYDFDTGASGQGVFDDLMDTIGLTDTSIGYLRAATEEVGEENVFRFGIFKTTSAITDTFVECENWYKIGLNLDSLFSKTESITIDNGSIIF